MGKLIYTDRKYTAKTAVCEAVISILTAIALMLFVTDLFNIQFDIAHPYRGGIAGGFAYFLNCITDTLLINDGIVLKRLAGASDSCELFITVITVIFAGLIYGIIRSGKRKLIFAIPAIAISAMLCTSAGQNTFCVNFLFVMTLIAFAYMKADKNSSVPGIAKLVCIALMLLAALSFPVISNVFEKTDFVSPIKEIAAEHISGIYYGYAPLGNGALAGDKRNTDDDIALEITMSEPEATYLRGYIGEAYAAGRWSPLPYSVYKDSRQLMYWLDREKFNGIGQLGQADNLVNDTTAVDFRIEVKEANKKYAYLPYEYISENDRLLNWYGSYITNGNFGRMKSYEFKAYENATGHWTGTAGELFTFAHDEAISNYLTDESWFNEFVYENYTYLSSAEIELLHENIGNRGDQSNGHIEYSTAIKKIRDYLNSNFIYTEDPALADDMVMEEFFNSKKGYDTHFATAAAFMFRYYGIPARYVEGYLVTPTDVKSAGEDGTMSISQQNAHAWVEIYIDGIGFVPIEVSPEYYDVMPQADLDKGFENSIVKSEFKPENSGGNTDAGQESRTNTEQNNLNILKAIRLILLIIAAGLLLSALAFIIRKIRASYKRYSFFKKGEPKKAVSAMFGYMEDMNLKPEEEVLWLGNKAAYSRQSVSQDERNYMMKQLKSMKKTARKEKFICRKKK